MSLEREYLPLEVTPLGTFQCTARHENRWHHILDFVLAELAAPQYSRLQLSVPTLTSTDSRHIVLFLLVKKNWWLHKALRLFQ